MSQPRKLTLENLQKRELMAADVGFNSASGLLTIQGSDHADTAIVVLEDNAIEVELKTRYSNGATITRKRNVDIGRVEKIVFKGNQGNDSFTLINRRDHDVQTNQHLAKLQLHLQGGSGHDRFENRSDIAMRAWGNSGNDHVLGGSGDDYISGGSGDDQLFGRTGDDIIRGDSGKDRVYGGLGDDDLDGGSERDWVFGSSGNDEIRGGSGNDWLRGDTGRDRIWGGKGNDTVDGGSGNDVLFGGNGTEEEIPWHHRRKVSSAWKHVYRDSGADRIYGGDGHDRLYGEGGPDKLYGGNGNDSLYGGRHVDELYGQDGNDYLFGMSLAADYARGRAHQDKLVGGKGADRFEYEGERYGRSNVLGFIDATRHRNITPPEDFSGSTGGCSVRSPHKCFGVGSVHDGDRMVDYDKYTFDTHNSAGLFGFEEGEKQDRYWAEYGIGFYR
ncbi:MAG: calcium-binding protein [Planctomycetota bacterium]